MHVFQRHAFRDIIYPSPIAVITKSFRKNQFINILFACKRFTTNLRLSQDYAKQSIFISSETYHVHDSFREEIIMKCYGF